MDIEIVTTKKRITKSIIKQFEDATWRTITSSDISHTSFYIVNDVYKFPIIIFKHISTWYKFPNHRYSISATGNDVYINDAMHMYVNDKSNAERFLSAIKLIKFIAVKIII